jgi:hypothetical protein
VTGTANLFAYCRSVNRLPIRPLIDAGVNVDSKETLVSIHRTKVRIIGSKFILGLGIAVGASLAMPALAAGAHAGAHNGARAGAGAGAHPGHSYTRTTQSQRTANGHTSHSTRTDAQGRTATRDATVANDKATGTRTKDVTYTGKDGATRTADTTTQRTDSGYTRDTTYTDKNGNTATREADVTVDRAAGTRSKDVTYTGRDGSVHTVDDTVTRTADGYERSTIATGPNGGSTTREAEVVHDAATHSTVKTVTVEHTPPPPAP